MWLFDRLSNLLSGLGTDKDKLTSNQYQLVVLSDVTLNAMHRSDWLSRKIVDIIPNDMTREWRDWQADDAQIEAIEAYEKSPLINLQLKINQALQKARLFGGAAIYLGMRDRAPDQPLDVDKVGKGDLEYLHVMTRAEVTAGEIDYDVTSEFYGQPKYYQLATPGTAEVLQIHPSRIVRFIGAEILDSRHGTGLNAGWGDSVLQICYDAVQNAGASQAHVASLIPELKTDVIYIPKLSEFLRSQATTSQLTQRFAYANQMKSQFNMTLLEGNGTEGEKWEQKQISFAQLPELIAQYLQIASGAADIPVTRLIGQSPKGLNATGDADIRNYYDNVAARQRTELQPALFRLDEVIIRSALGARDPSIYYTWAPLWGLSETEKATNFKTKSDAARALAGGLGQQPLLPIDALSEALINTFVEDGSLPGLEAAIEEFGTLAEQEPDETELESANTPPANSNDPPPRRAANDAAPRTLYVRRNLLNGDDLRAWAKAQGFTTTLPVDDMHVTITFSRTPVDWMKMGDTWSGDGKGNLTVAPGGARLVEKLGPSATVLLFNSSDLAWRHEDMIRNGASWDFPEFQPHVTISYTGAPDDLSKVEPYRGELRFGPEIFEEVNEDWKASIEED